MVLPIIHAWSLIMSVRAKFRFSGIKQYSWGSPGARELTFTAEYDTSIPEDLRFAQATPSGSLIILCDNPAATAQFELGKAYYLDLMPAEVPVPLVGESVPAEQNATGAGQGTLPPEVL